MNIKIINLATQESASMKLTREQVESLRGILFSGNYFIEVEKKQEVPSRGEVVDIFRATKGGKVIVTDWSANNGTDWDKLTVCDNLEIGKVYTIANIQIYGWSTDVQLEEVEGVTFNAANFEDYFVDSE